MNLGIFLPIGSSLAEQQKAGQDQRFIKYYLNNYALFFDQIYIFSYKNETYNLPKHCFLIPNKFNLHRFLYTLFLPFVNFQIIKKNRNYDEQERDIAKHFSGNKPHFCNKKPKLISGQKTDSADKNKKRDIAEIHRGDDNGNQYHRY